MLQLGLALTITALGLATLTQCSDSTGPGAPRTVFGPAVPMGNGTATGYVTLDGHGAVSASGVSCAPMALTGLPQTAMTTE
jgi:hypothetical protein